MALPKPPKDYYSLTEIAEEWEWSVGDIVEYGQQGKLALCVRLEHKRAIHTTGCFSSGEFGEELILPRDLSERHRRCNRILASILEGNNDFDNIIILDGVYPVLPQQLKEDLRYSNDCGEPVIGINNIHQGFEDIENAYCTRGYVFTDCKLRLLITHEEKTRFEKEHENLIVRGVQKEFSVRPREQEKPLFTMKDIANHCGVHMDTVKVWRKKYKDFPASAPNQGRVTALPSELNAWLVRKKKK
ncbi:MAG: hypothetical protein Q7W05_03965 [Deltaproteobacteria bacterium]|jgi:hypothetical protein|nr:hypothetical protein [Deltaproteobacteria bacterium]